MVSTHCGAFSVLFSIVCFVLSFELVMHDSYWLLELFVPEQQSVTANTVLTSTSYRRDELNGFWPVTHIRCAALCGTLQKLECLCKTFYWRCGECWGIERSRYHCARQASLTPDVNSATDVNISVTGHIPTIVGSWPAPSSSCIRDLGRDGHLRRPYMQRHSHQRAPTPSRRSYHPLRYK